MIKNNWTLFAALTLIFTLTGCGGGSSGSNNQPPLKQQCLTNPTPKVTIVTGGDHVIANNIWDDSYIGRGDAKYDRQNESIYDWFLRFTLDKN